MEDKERQEEGETVEQRIKGLLIQIMNDINQDLKWTIELEEDFGGKEYNDNGSKEETKRGIPTLDFEVYWDEGEGRFKYRYFEKEMRNPIVIQRRSAMDRRQKFGILSQELVRRLSNISTGRGNGKNRLQWWRGTPDS